MPPNVETPKKPDPIEMPQPTAAPVILAVGIVLMGAGFALGLVMSAVGGVVFIAGLAAWISHLQPGRGHFHEERVERERWPQPITAVPGTVEQMQAGRPGYRMRLPLTVHPVSAGIKGGILGGSVMPIPALLWGLTSGHGILFPINLLAGMVAVGVDAMPVAELEQFHLSLLLVGIVIHIVMSLVLGLIYGVILPAFPDIRGGPMVWGGVLMPLLWTGVCYGLMGIVNPLLKKEVDWPWFIASQIVFGIVAASVVVRSEKIAVRPAGTGPETASLTR